METFRTFKDALAAEDLALWLSDRGIRVATDQLVQLAAEFGDANELRRLANSGNTDAADQLIELATERGDLEELRRMAANGNVTAAEQLEELTAE